MGEGFPTEEGAWLPVQRAMRAHPRDSGVQAAAGVLLAVLACQDDYRVADLAAKFSGELLDALRGARALSATAATAREGGVPASVLCVGVDERGEMF